MKSPLTVQDKVAFLLYKLRPRLFLPKETPAERVKAVEATEEALYQAMQEVVGKDEAIWTAITDDDTYTDADAAYIMAMRQAKNYLRKQQRTRLNKLFGRGE